MKYLLKSLSLKLTKKLRQDSPLYRCFMNFFLKTSDAEEIFNEIFKRNAWNGDSSVSGPGSNALQTRTLRNKLPFLLNEYGIKTILDIPCGDFNWMKMVNLKDLEYIGADIVKDMIKKNDSLYRKKNISFKHLDIMNSSLPEVDLIICRDCLVHFSSSDIFSTFNNICYSGSKYLLTTTFPSHIKNTDIITGKWRTLNLEREPFNLPEPLKLIIENCTEGNGEYKDKSMGLWSIREICKIIQLGRS